MNCHSPVLRENLPPPSDNPHQPTEIILHEDCGMELVLAALDEQNDFQKPSYGLHIALLRRRRQLRCNS